MTRRHFKIVAAVIAIASATFAMLFVKPATHHPKCTWDFSKSHDESIVPWPAGVPASNPSISREVNGRVVVKFPEGKEFDHDVETVFFWRYRGQVIGIYFWMAAQTATDAYRTASDLAKGWNLDVEPLETWYERASKGPPIGSGESNEVASRQNDLPLSVSLEIKYSYQPDYPYKILFEIGWREK